MYPSFLVLLTVIISEIKARGIAVVARGNVYIESDAEGPLSEDNESEKRKFETVEGHFVANCSSFQ